MQKSGRSNSIVVARPATSASRNSRKKPCPHCQKLFRPDNLTRHIVRMHSNGSSSRAAALPLAASPNGSVGSNGSAPTTASIWKSKKSPCPECGKTGYKSAAAMAGHRFTIHGVRGTSAASIASQKRRAEGKGPYPSQMRKGKKPEAATVESGVAKIEKRGKFYRCPECKFKSPYAAVVGTHRNKAHGIVGIHHERNLKQRGKRGGGGEVIQAQLVPVTHALQHNHMPPMAARSTSFCPRCGILAGNFCGQCGANMHIVEAALTFRPNS
jgi:hypothetical protein